MKRYFCLILLLAALFCCSACEAEPVSSTELLMDTVCTVTLYDPADAALAEEALALAAQYEAILSSTAEGSDISRVNSAGGVPVEVSAETLAVLGLALEYARLSQGAFDVTVGGVSKLWDFGDGNHIPDAAVLSEALTHVGYENVTLRGNTVTLADPDTRLELGAVAKGYI